VSHLKNLKLKVWRQSVPADSGRFENYTIDEISDEASFLEMLDVLNENLISENKEAGVFDHDCREGQAFARLVPSRTRQDHLE